MWLINLSLSLSSVNEASTSNDQRLNVCNTLGPEYSVLIRAVTRKRFKNSAHRQLIGNEMDMTGLAQRHGGKT